MRSYKSRHHHNVNIFVLDKDPVLAAKYHCDKHVCKMLLEYSQILCTVLRIKGVEYGYFSTHPFTACVTWAKFDRNFIWLLRLAEELAKQYTLRYNKTHACEKKLKDIRIIIENTPELKELRYFSRLKDEDLVVSVGGKASDWPLGLPNHLRLDDVVASYRLFYWKYKYKFAKWKPVVGEPFWWNQEYILNEVMPLYIKRAEIGKTTKSVRSQIRVTALGPENIWNSETNPVIPIRNLVWYTDLN